MARGKNYRLTLATPKGSVVRTDDHAMAVTVEAKQRDTGFVQVGRLKVYWEEVSWESPNGEKLVLWQGGKDLKKRTI